MSEPILNDVVCMYCGHEWTALCPDGLNSKGVYLECPKCHKDGGKLLDEEEI